MNPVESFRQSMAASGIVWHGEIHADSSLHRFRVDGDNADSKNGWYRLRLNPVPFGAFGCWKRGVSEQWRGKDAKALSDEERREMQLLIEEEQRRREEEHRRAAALAEETWTNANAANPVHEYLVRKQVDPCGLKQLGETLIVPLRDIDGKMWSLQHIYPSGDKLFLERSRIRDCFYTFGELPADDSGKIRIILCEGFSTGGTIYQAEGCPVVAAMSAGNLSGVATALRTKYPKADLMLAADNDAFTESQNTGVKSATTASKSVRCKMVVPAFNGFKLDDKPTDFNDLAALAGPQVVQDQIRLGWASQVMRESDEDVFARLARMAPKDYDRCREREAKALGIRPPTLDKEINKLRNLMAEETVQMGQSELEDVIPWQESVDGSSVLSDISDSIRRYVFLSKPAADAIALWCAHCHCFETFQCTPRLNISSPEKGCGKSTLRDVIALLVPRPLPSENLSVAVMFRLVESRKPTLLADEYDAWIADNEELRGLLNSGHRKGGMTHRCVGDSHDVKSFRVFAPVALCGIGNLPPTLHDRSIVIRLQRATKADLKSRFDSRRTDCEKELCRKLARWILDNAEAIGSCEPHLPSDAFNRLGDNWRPLFALAETAGGEWPNRATKAFSELSLDDDSDAHGIVTELLKDIQSAIKDLKSDRVFSKDLVKALMRLEEGPWMEANRGKPISETWLAKKLKPLGICSGTIRDGGDRAKGYFLSDFENAFARYLPPEGESKRDSVTSPTNTVEEVCDSSVTAQGHVTSQHLHQTCASIDLSPCHASDASEEEKRALLI